MKKIIAAATLAAGLTGGFMDVAGAVKCDYPADSCKSGSVDPSTLPADVDPVVKAGGLSGVEVKGKQQLPVTGSDAVGLAVIGSVLIAGGGLLVWRSKATA